MVQKNRKVVNQMAYVILIDLLDCKTTAITTPEMIARYPYPFRLLDGDGNICFYGRSTTCDDQDAFAPLDWAKYDSGCTTVEYRDNWGDWLPL